MTRPGQANSTNVYLGIFTYTTFCKWLGLRFRTLLSIFTEPGKLSFKTNFESVVIVQRIAYEPGRESLPCL